MFASYNRVQFALQTVSCFALQTTLLRSEVTAQAVLLIQCGEVNGFQTLGNFGFLYRDNGWLHD